MSSTQFSLGLDDSVSNSTSIMKPPGGDCHDIFGADFHGTPSHHRVLKPPGGGTSGLFSTSSDEVDKPRVMVSPSASIATSTPSINGSEGKTNGVNGKSDGNPVTGEGYDNPETQPPAPPRARIPPGGYSSGLW